MISIIEIVEYLDNYMASIKNIRTRKYEKNTPVVQIKSISPEQIFNDKKVKKNLWKKNWTTFQDPMSVINYLYDKVPRMLFFEAVASFSMYGEDNGKKEITQACKDFISCHLTEQWDWMDLNQVYSRLDPAIKEQKKITLDDALQIKNFDFSFLKKVSSELKEMWKRFIFFNDKGEELWSKQICLFYLKIKTFKFNQIIKKFNISCIKPFGKFNSKFYNSSDIKNILEKKERELKTIMD